MLPSKTFPQNAARGAADSRKAAKRKAKNMKARERAKKRKQDSAPGGAPPAKKSYRATVEEVDDEEIDRPRRGGNSGNCASGSIVCFLSAA
jgi:hypothetical protein